jgi:hypothetical protein
LAINSFLTCSVVVDWRDDGVPLSFLAGLWRADDGPKLFVVPASSTDIKFAIFSSSSDDTIGVVALLSIG